MKLTVLGNTGPYSGEGGACSGYLIEDQNQKFVLDFGNGTLGNLQRFIKIEDLDFIICSHLHPDHFSDLYILRYALQERGMSLPLFVPSEPPLESASLYYKNAYAIKTLSKERVLLIKDLKITFEEMRHPVLDFAIKISNKKMNFLYTGDTAYTKKLVDFAKGVDVMLCDAAFVEDTDSSIHLSVKEACEIANEAGVKHLILTHFNPNASSKAYDDKGKAVFHGDLFVTEIGKSFDLEALLN